MEILKEFIHTFFQFTLLLLFFKTLKCVELLFLIFVTINKEIKKMGKNYVSDIAIN